MNQASEAIKKAIEDIEAAAPEAWRLTVEGYRAEALAELATSIAWLAGCAALLLFARKVWRISQHTDDRYDGEMLSAAAFVLTGLAVLIGCEQVGIRVAAPVCLSHIEGYAAKQLVEAALR